MTAHSKNRVIAPQERKTIDTLGRNDCRWPIGDPRHADFHFCGKQKSAGSPYCEFHARLSFQPSQPRRHNLPGVPARPGQTLPRQSERQQVSGVAQRLPARGAR